MLKIRLQRIGKRGQAYFRVVVTEHTQKPKGKYLELLGSYDPHKNEISADAEKVKYWLSQGAKMSETVNNLLVGKGVIEGEKVQVWKPKKKAAAAVSEQAPVAASAPAKPEATEKSKEEKTEEPALEIPKKEMVIEKSLPEISEEKSKPE